MNDAQTKWIGEGLEIAVGVLGILEQEHPRLHTQILKVLPR
jgi:hypothetical protein